MSTRPCPPSFPFPSGEGEAGRRGRVRGGVGATVPNGRLGPSYTGKSSSRRDSNDTETGKTKPFVNDFNVKCRIFITRNSSVIESPPKNCE